MFMMMMMMIEWDRAMLCAQMYVVLKGELFSIIFRALVQSTWK